MIRTHTPLLAVLLFSLVAAANGQPVRGIVVDAETMKPVEYVNIKNADSQTSLSTTDLLGRFEIKYHDVDSLLSIILAV